MIGAQQEALVEAVRAAGRQLLATWPGNPKAHGPQTLAVEVKRDGTIVTDADQASERILVAAVTAAIPEAVIVSEEDKSSHDKSADTLWFIDPLDGTRQYLAGSSDFAVLVSAWSRSEPIFSVAFFPAEGILVSVHERKICFGPHSEATPNDTLLIHTVYCESLDLRHHLPRNTKHLVDEYESTRVLIDIARAHAVGAIVLMCGHHAWDVAAPIHLIRASGGIVTDEHGQAVRLSGRGVPARYLVAARDEENHRRLLTALASAASPHREIPRTERNIAWRQSRS